LAPLRVRRRDGRGEKLRQCSIGAVRGILVFVAGGLGLGAFWRRRRHGIPGREPAYHLTYDGGPDPAKELRAKLAETKAVQSAEAPAVEAAPEPSPLDPQSRRSDVHQRARASIDELG
jgi:hypothetical protein